MHSPIVLRNQVAHIIESAALTVQAQPAGDHTPEHLEFAPHDPGNADGLLPPQSPNAMYHTFDRPHPDFRRILGQISGLPSTLTFSTTVTTKTYSRVERVGADGDMQTIITVDKESFPPGSIVLYRTSVAGASSDEPSLCIMGGLSISIPRSVSQTSVTPVGPGAFESLWAMMGMDRANEGIEMMVRLGWHTLDAGHLWYSADKARWPPALWEATEGLSMADINVALYRCGSEEEGTSGAVWWIRHCSTYILNSDLQVIMCTTFRAMASCRIADCKDLSLLCSLLLVTTTWGIHYSLTCVLDHGWS